MFYRPNIWKFQCRKEERNKVGGAKEDIGEAKTEVSYSVSGDLQIT